MKLKIGMYVRTEDGKIFKTDNDLIYLSNDKSILYRLITRIPHNTISYIVSKLSYNIIDLIKTWDLLFVDIDNGFAGGIVVPRIAEAKSELEIIKEKIKNGKYILKKVITHEELEKIGYELDE